MSVTACTDERLRDELLVAYLYDDLEPPEREVFGSHVAGCAACRTDLAGFQAVRADLARWTPSEPARVLTFAQPPPTRPASRWPDMPAWARAVAALLVLGIAAGIANVEVRYDRDGLSVRTGWRPPRTALGQTAAVAAPADEAPWRADLAALERSLRAELQTVSAAGPQRAVQTTDVDEEAVIRRVRALIEASERTQQRELALRVAETVRDVQAQRLADLQRIQRNLNVIETTTGGAIVRQGKLLSNLAVRVSQQ